MFGEKMHLEEDEDQPIQFAKRGKSNAGTKGHIDMTPMVDVVFQLLTFFLLAVKRQSQEEPLDVPVVAAETTAIAEGNATFITIKRSSATGEPEIVLGTNRRGTGEPVTPQQVEQEVKKGVESGRAHIIINAERNVRHGDVLRISRIVANVEGAKLYVGVSAKD